MADHTFIARGQICPRAVTKSLHSLVLLYRSCTGIWVTITMLQYYICLGIVGIISRSVHEVTALRRIAAH